MATDNILRVERNENYKTVNLFAVQEDDDLSAKACGLLWYLVSRPDGWKFYKSDIINRFSDGRTSVDNGLDELKEAGYLTMERTQDDAGQFDGWEWTISEVRETRMSENPSFGKPTPSNKYSSNEDVSSKDYNKNNEANWEEMGREEQLEASSPDQPCPSIRSIFDHCRKVRAEKLDKQSGPPLQLTQKRHSKIRARLQEGFSPEQLKLAYEGMLSRDFFVENGHTDVELAFRDDEKVRRHMTWYKQNVESKSGGSSSVRYWDD